MQVVGFVTARLSKQDLVLQDGNLIIPKNCSIFLPLGCPHMSPAIFPDADRFLPERWLEADAEYMPTVSESKFAGTSFGLQFRVT